MVRIAFILSAGVVDDQGDILGGPEIYNVARREFTAGLPGNSTAKIFEVRLAASGAEALLCSLRASTKGQF
jgi:hypothetical protein